MGTGINDESYGLVVINGDGHVLLGARIDHYEHWFLPKGHAEPGESKIEAAIRETAEEMMVNADIISPVELSTMYFVPDGRLKRVVYFVARPISIQSFVPNDEVEQIKWCSPEQVKDLNRHSGTREVIREALLLWENITH